MALELKPPPRYFDHILIGKVLEAECKVKIQDHSCCMFLSLQLKIMKTFTVMLRKQLFFFACGKFLISNVVYHNGI